MNSASDRPFWLGILSYMRIVKSLAAVFVAFALAGTAGAGPVSGRGTWETTLHARDINGDMIVDAYYDSALDVTWLADWNANGIATWDNQVAWAAALDVHGKAGWRLPRTTDSNNDGCNYSNAGGTDCGYNVDTNSSELAHMYYVTLGNLAFCTPGDAVCSPTQSGFGLANTANFINMLPDIYWSATEYAPSPSNAWLFRSDFGLQTNFVKSFGSFAVAVRPGDVIDGPSVPEPQMLGFAMAALGALTAVRRRRALAL